VTTRSEAASSIVFALAFIVATAGLVLLIGGILFETRSTIPGLGLLLFVVGVLLSYEFGIRTARRAGRPVLVSLRRGLAMLGRWSKRMVGVDRPKS
jgi:hypothetical protein